MTIDNIKDLINENDDISVTAGASTPQNIIDEVIKRLNSF